MQSYQNLQTFDFQQKEMSSKGFQKCVICNCSGAEGYFKFPSDEELTVEEVPLGSPYLRAGANHYGKYCEAQNNEFMLCRHETRNPQACLAEGKIVTACANEFFRKVKIASFFKYQ